mmetsp:Transcript_44553/g.172760  ORF Transcript_44553/g.172760 Transcript_44553/m.172760 type:complete len:133 (+) Transcript_44553:141-539(+)
MKHWLVSAPSEGGQGAYEMMREKLETKLGIGSVYPFRIPAFRVGTLDSLMALSDTLTKHDHAIEQVVDRLLRQYRDLSKKPVRLSQNILSLQRIISIPQRTVLIFPFWMIGCNTSEIEHAFRTCLRRISCLW